jgi:hypothetical protein
VGDPTKVTRSALQNAASIASLGGQRGDIQNAEDVVFMPRTSSSRMMMYSVPSSIGYRCPSTFQTGYRPRSGASGTRRAKRATFDPAEMVRLLH